MQFDTHPTADIQIDVVRCTPCFGDCVIKRAVQRSDIGLHAHHGGSLTEILTTVAESIDAEDNLRREVETLTADARLSAQVLLGLPVAALALLSLLSPGYATPLFSTSAGQTMCIIAGILGSAGWWWLRTLSRVGDAL